MVDLYIYRILLRKYGCLSPSWITKKKKKNQRTLTPLFNLMIKILWGMQTNYGNFRKINCYFIFYQKKKCVVTLSFLLKFIKIFLKVILSYYILQFNLGCKSKIRCFLPWIIHKKRYFSSQPVSHFYYIFRKYHNKYYVIWFIKILFAWAKKRAFKPLILYIIGTIQLNRLLYKLTSRQWFTSIIFWQL